MRDFKESAAFYAIEACLHEGPRDTRFSGATCSMTFDDEDDLEDCTSAPRQRDSKAMSEAEHHVADWYGLDDLNDKPIREKTWCSVP